MAKKNEFKTEVNQLLDLIIHSLYSHSEIFLRELVSNSSDAIDKLKYLTLTQDEYKGVAFDPRVDIKIAPDGSTLTISDSGVGMDREDLDNSLGTIARSGTKAFMENLTGDAKKDSDLIGQFGVGFYSAFMVADTIDVITKKANESEAYKWSSDGRTGYTIEEAERETHGTDVILYLNEKGKEDYSKRWEVTEIIKKYSNYTSFPIYLHYEDTRTEGEEDNQKEVKEWKEEQINSASALWKRSRSEIKEEEYNDFYKSVANDYEEPLFYTHTQAEGTLEYTTLFYIPKKAPFDLFRADFKPGVKLYIRRVFITDDSQELMPIYLRFLRGVIDSEDLPLNVSREILQQNRVLAKIREGAVKKVLSELLKLSKNDSEKFTLFVEQYNRLIKEGLYSDMANRETLMDIVRFKSTSQEGWVSLEEYKDRMPPEQKEIYYLTGSDLKALQNSPLISGFKNRGFEVLLMDDEIDEVVIPMMGPYKELNFTPINQSGVLDESKSEEEKKAEEAAAPVVKKIKDALGDKIKEVVASSNLVDLPSCVVADKDDPNAQLQQMMQAMGQELPPIKYVLEVNPTHPLIKELESVEDKERIEDISSVLLDQALLLEGSSLDDPTGFAKKLNKLILK